jgi:hypothetical protein
MVLRENREGRGVERARGNERDRESSVKEREGVKE